MTGRFRLGKDVDRHSQHGQDAPEHDAEDDHDDGVGTAQGEDDRVHGSTRDFKSSNVAGGAVMGHRKRARVIPRLEQRALECASGKYCVARPT